LGVEGLAQYVADDANASTAAPGILIISDMSAEPAPAKGSAPPAMLSSVLRAEDLVYQQLHARIFSSYTAGAYRPLAPSLKGYEVDADRLWPGRTGRVRVFIVSPASAGERARLSDKDDQIAAAIVADISTLLEPSPEQVNAAFWLGARAGRDY